MSTSTSTPTLSNTHAIHNDSSNTRSMSIPTRPRPRPRPRPRQLLDLPDEILCLILAYCSQDLDFLLWSCPLITAKDQFCHDCYHCSLCHGPLPQTKQLGTTASASQNTGSRRLRGFASSSNTNILSDYNHKSTVGGGNTSSNRVAENGNGNSSTNESIHSSSLGSVLVAKTLKSALIMFSSSGAIIPGHTNDTSPPTTNTLHLSGHDTFQGGPHLYTIILLYRPSNRSFFRHPQPPLLQLHVHSYHVEPRTKDSVSLKEAASQSAEENPLPELKPLSRTSPHHAFTRAQSWDQGTGHFESLAQELQSMHAVVSHANRRRARSMTLTTGVTLEGRNVSFPSEKYMDGHIPSATPQIASPPPSAIANNNANTVETQGRTISSGSEQADDEYTDSIELSAPFQLLLVNRRIADIAVRSLWKGIVFHGHDSFQVQALLSTLHGDEGTSNSNQPVVSQTDASNFGLDVVKDNNPVKSTPALLSVLDENEPSQVRSNLVDSVQQSVKRFNGVRHPAQTTATLSGGQQQQRVQARTPLLSRQDRYGVLRRHSTTGVEPARSPAPQSHSPPNLQSPVLMPRWSYQQMPRNIVLNFSHPQASPHLLVSVLECIGSRCRDQVKALDLRANEKMQAAGLETPRELERLFGSGFSRLEYLRLQGGFVDNQLLGALTKGIISATSPPPNSEATTSQEILRQQQLQAGPSTPLHVTPPCRLSQVFLGPGSVTDTAIAKLIVAASHCLEVFTVTSCVDVGGGALASLLTECPKLKVLAVHKSLARDVELLEGLGVDSHGLPSPTSPLGTILPDLLSSPSRKKIVAPLERLELGSVQLTSTGIAEIVRGVSRTLRFLVLEPRHFKEALLRDVIVPLCRKLEGLHFDDPDHYYQHQLQQYRMQKQQQQQQQQQQDLDQQQPPDQIQSPSVSSIPVTMEAENRRPKKRSFKLRRSRRPAAPELSPLDTSIAHKDDAVVAHDEGGSGCPRPSPWLGETSTAEWVDYGNCALWAASAVGSTAGFEANGGLISNGNGATGLSHSISGSRGRGVSSFFRGIGTRLASILSPRHNTNGNQEEVSALESTAAVATDHECDIDRILARFGLTAAELDQLRQVLAPTLKSFVVMQADLLPVAESKPVALSLDSLAEGDVVLMDDTLEELGKEEANMRLAVVLTVMAVYGSLATLAAALSVLPVETSELSTECM
ncbi:hypothetical protein K457DRAFT_126763 [Linnemannia elongata AG-77]|uniref:Uncharacterized protein n=1 Tax=Linnemannia elongata AG-77 TaxID=1314771 RepID=A0A197JVQ1_9FUNG|nr:hypothetical protein K457DRAFT_126763 [Linnemannia elongata AG-77]